MRIVDSKTCFYTIYGPMQIGALVGGAKESDLAALKEIGTATGRAFQIVDDILDMTADEKVFGKKNNGDLFEGKLTIPVLHMYKNANPEEKKRIDATYAKKRADKSNEEILYLRELMEKYGSIKYAQEMVERYGIEAKATFEKYRNVLPNNEYAPMFLQAVEEMYVRKK